MNPGGIEMFIRPDRNMEVEIIVRETLLKEIRALQRENAVLRRGNATYRERQRQVWAAGRRKK